MNEIKVSPHNEEDNYALGYENGFRDGWNEAKEQIIELSKKMDLLVKPNGEIL